MLQSRTSHRIGRQHVGRKDVDPAASADEARRAEDRGGRRLRLSAGGHRRSRGRRHAVGRRFGRHQPVGSPLRARSDAGSDDPGLPRGAPRRRARARQLRLSFRPVAGGDRAGGPRCDRAGQGGRRRSRQARWRFRVSRRRARDYARRHPRVGAVRHHAAHGAQVRRHGQCRSRPRHGHEGPPPRRGAVAGGRRGRAPRLHELRTGRRPRGGAGRLPFP